MFTRMIASALFAGAAAGLLAAVLQLLFVQPVLLHAELYETGQLVHFGNDTRPSADQELGGFEPLRDGLSIVFNMLVYSGYALIVVALMGLAETRGLTIDARRGLLWGIAGFAAVHLAPAFSLAPELPGVAAANVADRQLWWFATVIAASVALGLLAFGQNWSHWLGAAFLLLAPHLIGAPQPETFAGPVPSELSALFAARALGVGLAAWTLLGCLAAHFWQSETVHQSSRQTI